jgi:hypothetical protein
MKLKVIGCQSVVLTCSIRLSFAILVPISAPRKKNLVGPSGLEPLTSTMST